MGDRTVQGKRFLNLSDGQGTYRDEETKKYREDDNHNVVIAVVMKLGWVGSRGRFSEETVKKELRIKEKLKWREAIAEVT